MFHLNIFAQFVGINLSRMPSNLKVSVKSIDPKISVLFEPIEVEIECSRKMKTCVGFLELTSVLHRRREMVGS